MKLPEVFSEPRLIFLIQVRAAGEGLGSLAHLHCEDQAGGLAASPAVGAR